jgi:hypothetical protein
LSDLAAVLDRYAGANGPVFDFSNDPGIIFYLLGRVPATRFFHVSMAIPVLAQRQLVSELARSRPRVVVFKDDSNGLPEWDGVLNAVRHYEVSQYLLDHYVPLVDVDGTLVLLRSDLAAHAPPLPPLLGPSVTAGLYFDAPTCAWGDIPNFLRVPGEPVASSAVRIPTRVVAHALTTVTGWAVDHSLLAPAKEIVAVSGGRVVATAALGAARFDVVQALKSSQVLASGYTFAFASSGRPVQLYSLNEDGTLTPLTPAKTVASSVVTPGTAPRIRTTDGVDRRISSVIGRGSVDTAVTVSDRVESLVVPASMRITAYDRLELRATGPLPPGAVVVSDALGVPSHEITFTVLHSSASRVAVPVGSCPQWHGFQPSNVTLVQSATGPSPEVWLAR